MQWVAAARNNRNVYASDCEEGSSGEPEAACRNVNACIKESRQTQHAICAMSSRNALVVRSRPRARELSSDARAPTAHAEHNEQRDNHEDEHEEERGEAERGALIVLVVGGRRRDRRKHCTHVAIN